MDHNDPNKMRGEAPRQPDILQYFRYEHLQNEELKRISQACSELAHIMADSCPPSAELSAGLRKLLEAKDCFVRAKL